MLVGRAVCGFFYSSLLGLVGMLLFGMGWWGLIHFGYT